MQWIFREQPICDQGIDAHIEIVENGNPTGNLIGVQIKTGLSHFTIKNDSLVYYGKLVHLDYWLSHSLPVILVAHLPESNETFWVSISKNSVECTPKAWKITIPKTQVLNKAAVADLQKLIEGTVDNIRYKNLLLNLGYMKFLAAGGRLLIYKEEWHNKTAGRGTFNLIRLDSDGSEEVIKSDDIWYIGLDIKELVNQVYPWAAVGIDTEFYDDNFSKSFYSVYTDMYKDNHSIYPYEVLCGEVSCYRLELSLNELGKSFISVVNYLGQ